MNTESIETRKVASGGMERPGDFSFSEDFDCIYLWMPGMPGPDAIHIQRGQPGGDRVWGWDGDEDRPTLTPSLHVPGCWHGYLQSGRLQSC